jgi:hypothetical protein
MEEEEVEWENELSENILKLCENGGADATTIVVDGTAVRRKHGLVIISGELNCWDGSTVALIYDHVNDSIREGPEMKVSRFGHTSVTLPTGDVVVFGGFSRYIGGQTSSCEVFSMKSNSFSEIGNMLQKRYAFSAVLLPSGLVFIVGGHGYNECLDSCEFYNPVDSKCCLSKAKMKIGRKRHTTSLLPNGKVLVCGGDDRFKVFKTTEVYDPTTDSFSAGPLMTTSRSGHTATTLLNGTVLLTGGESATSSTSTEIYDPEKNSFSSGPPLAVERLNHFSALLPDGRVLIGGGMFIESMQTTETYDPVTNSFSDSLTHRQRSTTFASATPF